MVRNKGEVALNSNRVCNTGIPGATLALLLVIVSPSMPVLAEGSGDYKHHNIGVFLGATNEASGSTESTRGLEYGYRFTPHFGVGVVYEKTDEAHHGDGAEVLLDSLYYNPYANWRLGIGVGQEEIGGSHSHRETLYRASVAYHFHVGKFALSPLAAVDWVDGDNLYVFGVASSRPF